MQNNNIDKRKCVIITLNLFLLQLVDKFINSIF